MADNSLGSLRRSSVVMTFAPGAVVDFRADGAAVSAVVAGLEEWDRAFPPVGILNPQAIFEPRLQKKLGVGGFRLPPVVPEDDKTRRSLVAVRFPAWLQCPKCDKIARESRWGREPGRAYRYCGACTKDEPAKRRVAVIPVRFVLACTSGHLDEFPWHFWVGHKKECGNVKPDGELFLRAERPGLAGLILSCPKCKASRPMEGALAKGTFEGWRCRARRPWLTAEIDPAGCSVGAGSSAPLVRGVQRGASNLYFPVIESALDIPPWSDQLQQTLGVYWDALVNTATADDRRDLIRNLSSSVLTEALQQLKMSPDQLANLLEERLAGLDEQAGEDLRLDEYRKLTSGVDTTRDDGVEFEIRNATVPQALSPYIRRVVRVTRLREVRALTGFTRIHPPELDSASARAPISSRKSNWLPAIEVRGEGIFVALDINPLAEWESRSTVVSRVARLASTVRDDWRERHGDERPCPIVITPRFLLLHTLAHALIRQLTLECGYSTASLRERLYVGEGPQGMCGFLIYTSTPDSDGTLGGLERQGLPKRFGPAFVNAIRALEWCSSDPLCIEGAIGGLDSHSLAACHACCLAPETSCEHYNRYLDRGLLVGTPDGPEDGFFRGLISGDSHGVDLASHDSA